MLSLKAFFNQAWLIFLASIQGFWLFLLYFLVGYIMIGSLGSLQLRDALEAEQQGATYDEVISYKQEFEIKSNFIRNQNRRHSEMLYTEVNQLENQIDGYWNNMFQEAIDRNIVPADFIESYPETYYYDALHRIRTFCSRNKSEESTGPVRDQSSEQSPQTVLCLNLNEYSQLANEADAMYSKIDQEIRAHENDREVLELDEISKLRKTTPFADLFTTVQFMDDYGFSAFLRQPRELLVLQLTMVMGMLGSLVTMTWLFIRRDTDLGARRTLFLPLVGSVSAFIIFVFFKAGQLTISSSTGTSSLSPFFLSFVGIISGLLSERAYARMESIGTKFFTVDGDNLRWGIRLRETLEESDVSLTQLANYLGIEEGKASNLVDEVTPATQKQQALIAACLRKEARWLFTDEPPAGYTAQKQECSPNLVRVPQLIGLPVDDVEDVLGIHGLELGETLEIVGSNDEVGLVLSQDPNCEQTVVKGAEINITVGICDGQNLADSVEKSV